MTIKVLIADDHQLMREGLRRILDGAPGIVIAGYAVDGNDVLGIVGRVAADVLLLDLSMPGPNGIGLIARLHAQAPRMAILVLTMYDERHYAVRAMRAGALGFLTKESASAGDLVAAIRSVAVGRPVVSAAVAAQLAKRGVPRAHAQLSAREREVFDMLVRGDKLTCIGRALGLSIKTVSTYRTRILQKLNLASLVDMVQYAIEEELVGMASPAVQAHARVQPPIMVPGTHERRRCSLTESKVNVALILRDMLGSEDARIYLSNASVPAHVAARVISHPERCREHAARQSGAAPEAPQTCQPGRSHA